MTKKYALFILLSCLKLRSNIIMVIIFSHIAVPDHESQT